MKTKFVQRKDQGRLNGHSKHRSHTKLFGVGLRSFSVYFILILGVSTLAIEKASAQTTAPTITSSNTASVAENRTAVLDVDATDDTDWEGSGLTFSLSGGADQALFSVDAVTGVVTFKSAPDYEIPTDQGADNRYDIQVAVTDSSSLTSTQDIVITIIDLTCSASSLTAPTEAVFNAALDCYKELSAGSFTIDVTGSFTLTTSPHDVSNHNGVALTINGGGHMIDGAGQYTPITVSAGTVTIDNVTLQNGSGSNGGAVHIASGVDATISNAVVQDSSATVGGAIWNAGTVTVSNSTVSGSSSNSGGGLRNDGIATVSNSTFSGNSTSRSGEGGGISNYGTATVNSSTFTGNSGAFGAALYTRGTLNVNNSTVSANTASSLAGGIYVFWSGSVTATNTTITGSSAKVGGGILNNGGTMNMVNSIVANTTRGDNCYGTIGNTNSLTDDGSCGGMTQSTSINLGPLQDNGGPTLTHALLTNSAAIDTGDATICAAADVNNLDQRGVARPHGINCEIGAFEMVTCGNFAPTPVAPLGVSTFNNPTFSWTGYTACEWYQIYVNDGGGSLAYQTWYTSAQTACDNDTSCEIATANILAAGNHTWWVRGWSSSEGATPWSPQNTFDVTDATDCTAAPATHAPINTSGTLPTYQWQGQAECTWYQIYVNDSSGNQIYQAWYTAAESNCDADDTCEVTPTTALAVQDHTWGVQGYKAGTLHTPWSTGKTFNVTPNCDGAPTPLAPTDVITDTTPTYTWSGNSACTWYQLWTNVDGSNVHVSWYTATDANCDSDTSCDITPTTTLGSGRHTWWVRGWSSAAGSGPWGGGIGFTLP